MVLQFAVILLNGLVRIFKLTAMLTSLKTTPFVVLLIATVTVAASVRVQAQSFLDHNFLVDTSGITATVALASGKILIGGSLNSVNGFPRPRKARVVLRNRIQ